MAHLKAAQIYHHHDHHHHHLCRVSIFSKIQKNQEDHNGIVDLLKVIASQGVGGKNKTKKSSDYEEKMIMNSKHNQMADIPKDIILETLVEWQYEYTSML